MLSGPLIRGVRLGVDSPSTPVQRAVVVGPAHRHQLLVALVPDLAAGQLQGIRRDGHGVRVGDVVQPSFQVARRPPGRPAPPRLVQGDGHVGRQSVPPLQSAEQLLMMQEPHVPERAVLQLVLLNPHRRVREHRLVDVHQLVRLRKGLEHEGREPQAPRFVPVAEGGEAAVPAPVRELPLVADRHQMLGLGHHLRLQLLRLLQVPCDVHVGREQDHVLLAAPEGHPQQPVQATDALRQEAPRQRDVRPAGPLDGLERQLGAQLNLLPVGQHVVPNLLHLDALRLHQHLPDDGVRRLRAARRDLDGVGAQALWANHELGAADVVCAEHHRLQWCVEELVPVCPLDLHEYLLLRVKVVE